MEKKRKSSRRGTTSSHRIKLETHLSSPLEQNKKSNQYHDHGSNLYLSNKLVNSSCNVFRSICCFQQSPPASHSVFLPCIVPSLFSSSSLDTGRKTKPRRLSLFSPSPSLFVSLPPCWSREEAVSPFSTAV